MLAPPQLVGVAVGIVGQEIGAVSGDLAGLLAPLPRRAARIADRGHQPGGGVEQAIGQRRPGNVEHRRAQHHGRGIDPALGQGAQDKVPAHRMADQHVGPGGLRLPRGPEPGEVADPDREVVDMPGHGVEAEPAGPGLPAPVRRGHAPALARPIGQRFQVFLIGVAAPRHEQDRAARSAGPVDPADRMAVSQRPARFRRRGGDRAAVEGKAGLAGLLFSARHWLV